MGFFTRLIAGLVAASTLGAGLAGTAGAVDTTGATGDAKDVVKLASDDTSGLPDHLVNGDFEYPGANVLSKNRYDEKASWNWWGVSRKDKMVYDSDHETQWVSLPSTFDSGKFAWDSTEVAGTQNGSSQWHTNEVELQRDSRTGNMYGELCAYQANTSIRQYIRTTPGVLYKVRLEHASLSRDYLDKMQVLIGPAGNEQPVRMTRVGSQNGLDATGESTASTTVSTHASNEMEIKDGQGTPYSSRNHDGQWATYEGVYVATSDVTSFTFKSVDAKAWNLGNLLDDIVFDKAYRLSYDKNASDASGQVPSNERGRENTVQPAKAKTTGTVRTVADDAAGRTVLECKQSGEGATGPYADNFCWIDWSNLPLSRTGEPIPVRINVPGGHIDADATITHTNNAALAAKDFIGSKWSRLTSAYKLTGNTALAFSGRMGRQDPAASVTFSNITPSADRTDTGVNVLKDFRLAFGDAEVMSGGVLQGHDVYEQTDIESDKTLEKLGMIGSGDPNQSYSKANTGYGTTHVTLAGGPKGATDDVNKDSKGSAVVGAKQASQFKVSFKQVNQHWDGWGSAIAVGVYMPYLTAYPLTYDKNASDATGEVPSNQRGRENTTQPAKDKTSGTVRLASDDDVVEYAANGLPKQIMNGDFDHDWRNIVGQSKMSEKYNFANIDPAHGDVEISGALNNKGEASKQWVHLNGFDASQFGWKSNQTDTRVDGRGGIVEIQRSRANDNMYAEITASQANTYLYQDIDTAHDSPTVYTVKLRYAHRNGTINSNEKIQILVGAPGHEQPVEMTRIASDRGNKLGEKSTTVNAPNTDGWLGSWDTFQGSVVVPAGQNVSRFTFKALGSIDGVTGNLIDDVQFKLAYPLSYDKNAQDATGSVPSSQYGKENTVKPAEAKTTGTVKTVADDDSSKSLTVNPGFDVPDYSKLNDGGLHWMYVSPAEGEAWSFYDYINPAQPRHQVAGLSQATFGWQELTGGDYKTTSFELHREKDGNVCADVHGSRTIGQTIDTQAGVAYTVSIRHSGRSKGNAGSVQVLVGPDRDHLRPLEMSRMNVSRTGAKYGDSIGSVGTVITTHSDSVDSTEGDHPTWDHSDDWETYSGTYVATGGKTVFAYRGVDKNGNAASGNDSVVDSVIDDLSFKLAYPLAYDKNAADASGQVPSNTTPDTTQTASSKPTGKVSDLVQRTTTHEDGSVTVRTVDQSTDVVSGCQVYYPAGQRITLATLAKDNDCWDSSMLTRPGHTQLGWSQDSQATQAQAEVTMVEGGMTVYAVWVGNPVLTYDTNKPNTWNGQMPSTPASVSVAYNTAAADGSGWQSGDTSKIRGYRFLGWYAGPQDDSGLYDWNTLLTGNVTVYAHWQRLQANVVYDANGGTGSHGTTTGWQYSDVTVPSDTSKSFKRDGYVFLGWDTQADGNGTAYKDGSQVPLQDKDITLYAQWQPVFEQFTPTGGVSLPLLVAGGVTLLVMGIGSTVMLTRRMRGEQ